MEKAIVYNKISFPEKTKYKIIYVGDEFCDYKMLNSIPKKKMKGTKYVLLTPIVRDSYLKDIKKIIKIFNPEEITINDIGLLYNLSNSKKKYKINIGRILVKTNYLSFSFGFWQEIIRKTNAIETDDIYLLHILRKFGITKIHLHWNYKYISLTHNCLFKKEPKCFLSNYCERYNNIKYKFKDKDFIMFVKGNGYFIRNNSKNYNFNKINYISRLIYNYENKDSSWIKQKI